MDRYSSTLRDIFCFVITNLTNVNEQLFQNYGATPRSVQSQFHFILLHRSRGQEEKSALCRLRSSLPAPVHFCSTGIRTT